MAKTPAERMRASRERKRNSATHVAPSERNTPSATDVAQPSSATDTESKPVTGPLDVYSERRWAFLQRRGHEWDADRQRSLRSGPNGTTIMGVTVPGDPACDGVVEDWHR